MGRLDLETIAPLVEMLDTPTIQSDNIARVDIIGNKMILTACTVQIAADGTKEWPISGRLSIQIDALPWLLQRMCAAAAMANITLPKFRTGIVN